MLEIDIFKYDINFIKDKLSQYNYIIDEKNRYALIEHKGLLRLFNEIIGDSILNVYYQLYFNELYYTDLTALGFDEIIYKNKLYINCTDKIVLKTNNGFSVFTGFIRPLDISEYYTN